MFVQKGSVLFITVDRDVTNYLEVQNWLEENIDSKNFLRIIVNVGYM